MRYILIGYAAPGPIYSRLKFCDLLCWREFCYPFLNAYYWLEVRLPGHFATSLVDARTPDIADDRQLRLLLRDTSLDKLVKKGWTCGEPLRHHLVHIGLIDDKIDRMRRDMDDHALRRHVDRDMPLCWLLLLLFRHALVILNIQSTMCLLLLLWRGSVFFCHCHFICPFNCCSTSSEPVTFTL